MRISPFKKFLSLSSLFCLGQAALAAPSLREVIAWNTLSSDLDAMIPFALQPLVTDRIGSLVVLRVPDGMSEERFIREVKSSGAYQYVEPNTVVYPCALPSDPLFPQQWHHQQISSPRAWDFSKGAGVTIAYVDTGIELTHPEFAGRFVSGYNSAQNRTQAAGGAVTDVSSIGHGTMVAGVAAAAWDGNGVVGVAPESLIMPIRATDNPTGAATMPAIVRGIQWAADRHVPIINVSYQGVSSYLAREAGRYAADRGSKVVWAAGNDGANLDFDWGDVIVVGGTDESDNLATFSSGSTARGRAIDVLAPAKQIVTTVRGGQTGIGEGTSLAAPQVSGTLACISDVLIPLYANDLEYRLFAPAKRLDHAEVGSATGFGRLSSGSSVSWPAVMMKRYSPDVVPGERERYVGILSDGTLLVDSNQITHPPYSYYDGVATPLNQFRSATMGGVIIGFSPNGRILARVGWINFNEYAIKVGDIEGSATDITFPIPPGYTRVYMDDDAVIAQWGVFTADGGAILCMGLEVGNSAWHYGLFRLRPGETQAEFIPPPGGFVSLFGTQDKVPFVYSDTDNTLLASYHTGEPDSTIPFQYDLSAETWTLASPEIGEPLCSLWDSGNVGQSAGGFNLVNGVEAGFISNPLPVTLAARGNLFGEIAALGQGLVPYVFRGRGHDGSEAPFAFLSRVQNPSGFGTEIFGSIDAAYRFFGVWGYYVPVPTLSLPVDFTGGQDPITIGSIPPVLAVDFLDAQGNPIPNSGGTQILSVNSVSQTDPIVVPDAVQGSFRVFVRCNADVAPAWTGSGYLSRIYPPLNMAPMPLDAAGSIGTVELGLGDIDSDNEVGPGDFAAITSAFGSVQGDPNWNSHADIDRDGEVGPGDFGILTVNFGEVGDSLP